MATGCSSGSNTDKYHTELVKTAEVEEVTLVNSKIDDDKTKIDQKISIESNEFNLDLGDGTRTFKVIMMAQPFEEGVTELLYDSNLTISIYSADNLTVPQQVLYDKTNGRLFEDYVILDANFDGYNDFGYVDYRGSSSVNSHYYLWNNEDSIFEYSEDLSELPIVSFDSSSNTINAHWKNSASSHSTRLYRFIDGELVCIRLLYILPSEIEGISIFGVEELGDNVLFEVVNKNVTLENLDEIYDEYVLWMNSEYLGE
jgi:hypothetical protein